MAYCEKRETRVVAFLDETVIDLEKSINAYAIGHDLEIVQVSHTSEITPHGERCTAMVIFTTGNM